MTFNQKVAGSNPTELTNKKTTREGVFFVGMSERIRTRETAGSTPNESETKVSRSPIGDECEGGAKRNNPTELTNKKTTREGGFFVGMSERIRTRETAGSTPNESETKVSRSPIGDECEGGAKRNNPTELTNKKTTREGGFFVGMSERMGSSGSSSKVGQGIKIIGLSPAKARIGEKF